MVSGVVLMNALEQAGVGSKFGTLAAALLYTGGWASFSSGAALATPGMVRRVAVFGTSGAIAASTFLLRSDLKAGRSPSWVGLVGFFAGWMGLALALGSARGRYLKPACGAAAAAGGMALMPWRGAACGPAASLLTLGWVLISTALR